MRGYALLAAVSLMPLVCGCGGGSEPPAEPPQPQGPRIGVNLSGLDAGWREVLTADLERLQSQGLPGGAKLVVQEATENDAVQAKQVSELLSLELKGMIVAPRDAQSLTPPVAAAMAAKTPVVVLRRPVIGNQCSMMLDTNDEEIGRLAAQWITAQFEGTVTIVELKGSSYPLTSAPCHEGFKNTLVDPRFRILLEAETEGKPEEARKQMHEALKRSKEIQVVFTHSPEVAAAAHEEAVRAGLADSICFVTTGTMSDFAPPPSLPSYTGAVIYFSSGAKAAMQAITAGLEGKEPPRHQSLRLELVSRGG
ncbi:MAG: substrate-binding domain-containing protein [Planctomycetota bacterium]